MNNYRSLLLAIVIIFSFFTSSAQKPKVFEKSIFWKITPKEGGKPSYLYGTMHVSKKVAFRLPEEFYDAVKSVDFVALESNPENWTEEIEKSGDLKELLTLSSMGLKNNNMYGSSFYEYSYGQKPLNNSTLKRQLSYEPQSANELLFRSYGGFKGNFEEDTYLDLYIFKTGKKFGIPVISLENITWSLETVMKASLDAANPTKQRNKKNVYLGNMQTELEDAYREHDLNKLDSIQKASSPNDDYLNGLLYIRNDTMYKTMSTLMKQGKSVFSAVGAAHLGGEKGLLLKFIDAGFKVTPVEYKTNLDPSEQINKLDTMFVPVQFKKRTSRDSTLTFYTPAYTAASAPNGNVEYLSADMTNGVYYYIGRLNTFQYLSDLSSKEIESKIDSLIFENTQGSILQKKKIVFQTYPGFDIESKTKSGKIIKQRILITPAELLFCKVVGKEDYFKQNNVDSFFNLLQINYQANNTGRIDFLADVELSMPLSIKECAYEKMEFNSPNLLLQGVDQDGDYYQFLRNYTVRQYEHEEDTFHLNMYVHFFAQSFDYTTISQTHTKLAGLPAVIAEFKTKENNKVFAAFISRASNVYFLIAGTSKKEKAMAFFQSVKLKQDLRQNLYTYKDTSEGFSFRTPLKPMGGKFSKELFSQYLKGGGEYDFAKRKDVFSTVFQDNDLGYQYTIGIQELNAYESYPTIDSFWKSYYKESFPEFDEKYIVSKKNWKEGNAYVMLMNVKDTNTVNESIVKTILSGDKIFQLLTFRDTLSKNFNLLDSAINTVSFNSSKPNRILLSKIDTFFSHIISKDSATKEFLTKNTNYYNVLPGEEGKLRSMLDTSEVLKKKDDLYHTILYKLDSDTSDANLKFLETLFRKNEANAQRQIVILNTLAYMNSYKATKLFKTLLTEAPPLEFEEDDNPLNHYYDTLTLAKQLFPELMQLIDYDEYKMDVVYLLSNLMSRKLIDSSMYEQKVNYFTIKGKEEVRRKTSSKSTLEEEQDKEADEDTEASAVSNIFSGSINSTSLEEFDYNSLLNFPEYYLINHYQILLKPYKKRPNVKQFFDKIDSTSNKDLRFASAMDNMHDSLLFDKSIIQEYAALPSYKYKIIHDFYFNQQEKKIPFKINGQQDIARAKILNNLQLKDKDTLLFVDKVLAQSKKNQGMVYIFKYKQVKDEEFKYAYMGFFDKNEKVLLPKYSILRTGLEADKKPAKELIANWLQQIRVMDRTYITPEQMKLDGKNDMSNYLDLFRNMGGE
ncbi:MAG: TraB/GumN family protein [Chitinophagaceae bacterium]|nr:TraB/GumN family protein [Chitinophagaceae bacterium]